MCPPHFHPHPSRGMMLDLHPWWWRRRGGRWCFWWEDGLGNCSAPGCSGCSRTSDQSRPWGSAQRYHIPKETWNPHPLEEWGKVQVPLGPLGTRCSRLAALWCCAALSLISTVPLKSFIGTSLGLERSPATLTMKLSLASQWDNSAAWHWLRQSFGWASTSFWPGPCSSITREHARNANSQFPPQTTCIRSSGDGAQQSVFPQPLGIILMHTQV